jgi:hypothetical protein
MGESSPIRCTSFRAYQVHTLLWRTGDAKMPGLWSNAWLLTVGIPLLVTMSVVLSACQILPSPPSASSSCSFEQVWDTAIASLEGLPLQSAEKTKGRIETGWREIESTTRAGLLQRDVNKERFKFIVEVAPGGVTNATVQQLREAWSPMGVRMREWRAIPGNASEEAALAAQISSRLKEKGC